MSIYKKIQKKFTTQFSNSKVSDILSSKKVAESLPTFAGNVEALTGGLVPGDLYIENASGRNYICVVV